jgi:hypothetical protein
MALSQQYSAIAGHIITAARWNNEFGNIYTNGTDLAFPLTKAVSFAGYTVTYDIAGTSHITSTASTGFLMTIGGKSGAPGVNGGCLTVSAGIFTDSSTPASGTAALWTGVSIRQPTLHASQLNVTTTDANTVYIEGPPIAGTNQTFTESNALLVNGKLKVTGDIRLRTEDARTNTVVAPLTVQATTTGTPAAGIGVGISFHAESADENPSVVGRTDFAFSDVTAGSEDSYFSLLLRNAGAGANEAYRLQRTTAFKAILTHANSADRTYTLPDRSLTIGTGDIYVGPSSVGSGSTAAHEGTVTYSANQSLMGVHFYTSMTLNAGITLTGVALKHRLIIIASEALTINGTIDLTGCGNGPGGTGSTGGGGTATAYGWSQPGGGGGGSAAINVGGSGAAVRLHELVLAAGGAGGAPHATQPGSLTAEYANFGSIFEVFGGAAGGGGGGNGVVAGTDGSAGGGSLVLIAPSITLGSSSSLITKGAAAGAPANPGGAGGGGGGGNIIMYCQTYTDNGCVFNTSGGAPGTPSAGGGIGAQGANGIKQINIYA